MPDVAQNTQSISAHPTNEPEIFTIPEKFYGAALKAQLPSAHKDTGAGGLTQPVAAHAWLPYVFVGIGVVLLGTGAFVYVQRDVLFSKPVPYVAPVVVVPKIEPPATPSGISATSTNPQSVSVSWTDVATNETGYRVERAEESGAFQSLTSLSSNSTSFQDVAVNPEKHYRYRVIALNQAGESSASDEALAMVPALPPPTPEGPKLPPAGLDTDSDGLTDLEEELFGTDTRSPDSDMDGFLDGNEVFHLYNPGGRAPGRLIEAGLVKEERATVQWAMSIPTTWTMKQLDAQGLRALIDTGRPEAFTLAIEENPSNMSMVEWYQASHPGVQESQLLHFRSKKGYEGIIGADLLTTYIPWGNRVFIFTYDLKGQPFINYRTTYSMMLNSLMLSGLPQTTPPVAGAPLPFEPAATTTGVVAQPEALLPEVTP